MSDQHSFAAGETVKVIGGPFATCTGKIREVNQNRQMLLVVIQLKKSHPLVKVGAGEIPVELKFQDVVRVAP